MGDESDEGEESELVQVSHLVPAEHRKAASANADYGALSKAVRDVYRVFSEGGTLARARLEVQLEQVQQDRDRLEERVEEMEEQLDHLAERESQLRDRIEEAERREVRFEDVLGELDEMLQSGEHVFPSHGKVQTAANLSSHTPEEVVAILKERNADVEEDRFAQKDVTDWGDER